MPVKTLQRKQNTRPSPRPAVDPVRVEKYQHGPLHIPHAAETFQTSALLDIVHRSCQLISAVVDTRLPEANVEAPPSLLPTDFDMPPTAVDDQGAAPKASSRKGFG